jgi:transcriptional regulator with XRE-family HTH domain
MLGVAQRTISRWERGEDKPSLDQQRQLRDLDWEPTGTLLRGLCHAVAHCPAPRALSRTQSLRLQAVSRPAIIKRPSVTEWIGRDLARIACGVLAEMLDDRALQASIGNGEISCVLATTRSVLQTPEHPTIGTYRTTISYFLPRGHALQRCHLRARSTRCLPGLRGHSHGRCQRLAALTTGSGSFLPHRCGVVFLTPERSWVGLECL